MTLENFKNNFLEPHNWLRLALALIFFSAGLFRVFNPDAAAAELSELKLPAFLTWVILIIELGGGILLFLGKQVKLVVSLFIIFLLVALSAALVANGQEIITTAHKLFVFDPEPTDFFMHLIFLLILVTLLFKSSRK